MSSISQITGKKPRVTVVSGQTGKLVLLVSGNGKSRGCMRLSERNVLIGSSPNCTVRLQSLGVRDFQCQIIQGKVQTIVRNLSPDTRLNDQSFTEAWLKPGDRISCGQMDINVLEVGSPNTELPSVTKNEAAGNELPQPTVSREQLQQLKRQAAELRRKLEENRQRSDLRAEELEANLMASRDHLRNTREQLTALLGAPKMMELPPQPEQAVEPAVQTVAAAQESAEADDNFDWCQNFRAAEACCEGEDFESDEYFESWQIDSLEKPVDAAAENFASATHEELENDNSLPAEPEAFSLDEDSDISRFSELDETYQIEYVDSLDEKDYCESIEEIYEASDGLIAYDDDLAFVDAIVQEDSELPADNADETSTEVEFVAESLKAWFNQPSENAGLETNENWPAERDDANCELPEELKALIRECQAEGAGVEVESEHEAESLPTDGELTQVDELVEFEQLREFVLHESPCGDESGEKEVTSLVSESQEFVASESEVFDANVSQLCDREESSCEVVEQSATEFSESEQFSKRRSLIDRILSLFRKGPALTEQSVETVEEESCCELTAASSETETALPVKVEQLSSESTTVEEKNPFDEDFDLTADLPEFEDEHQPQLAPSMPETEAVEVPGIECASVAAQPGEQVWSLEAASLSLSEVPATLNSEADLADESADNDCLVEELPTNQVRELSALDCDHQDELEASYEKALDSMYESVEKESVSVVEVVQPNMDAGERVSCYDQIKNNLWHQCESGPQSIEVVHAEFEFHEHDQPTTFASELANGVTRELGPSESPQIAAESQEEESIEDYMNRLLQRVGASRQSTISENRQPAVQPSVIAKQQAEQLPLPQDLLAQTFSQDLESRKKELGPIEISPKSLPVLETDHIDQMRLMARESANSAIEASFRRKTATQATTQLGIGCMLLVGGIVQTTLADGLTSASVLATIPCYAAALYFFKKYFDWRKSFTSLDAKLAKEAKQKRSEEPNADKPLSQTDAVRPQ